MDLGEKLKKVRLDAGLSQRQVCGERITRNMLSQIENGSARPSMDTLRYLADRLGKPLGYFLDTDSDSLHAARLAYAEGNGLGMLDALSDTDTTTPEGAFLQKLGFLLAGEQALREQRLPYARDLLERCGQLESAYWQPETERRRQMGLCRADPAAPAPEVPPEEDLLLRAELALRAGKTALAGAWLDCLDDRRSRKWRLLRCDVYLAEQNPAAALEVLRPLGEDTETLPRLETCYRETGDFQNAYRCAVAQR